MGETIPKGVCMEPVGPPPRIPKHRYLSRAFQRLEAERLWPRVWQLACRSDDVAEPGDWLEYTIAEQSILVVRGDDRRLRAFHNVCQHRGNRLARGRGRSRRLVCGYHGWTWNLDGTLHRVSQAERFGTLDAERCGLPAVRVEEWGGFAFVCPAAPTERVPDLLDWLGPVPAQLAPYHLERHTCTQDVSLVIEANWKTVVDAFNESYHVQGVHPQLLPFFDDVATVYECFDPHSRMLVPVAQPSGLLGPVSRREVFRAMVRNASGTDTELGRAEDPEAAADALAALELPEGTTVRDWLVAATRARAAAIGQDLSGLCDDQVAGDWHYHLFPNAILNVYAGSFWLFRMRPEGDDPGRMRFDFQDYQWIPDPDEAEARRAEHRDVRLGEHSFGEVLDQDLAMLAGVQCGMRSAGFRELVLSSMETRIALMHRVLDRFLDAESEGGE
jgi:phenylpropionate dioxygenase-like ring-hydroxylating dioxygenase large terminal subunit